MAQTKARKTKSPEPLKSVNPRTGEVLREVPTIDPAEVAEIVAQARKVAPEWAALEPEGRARLLREVRYRIYDRMDDIIEVVAAETGKPRFEALAHDVVPVLVMLLYFERMAGKFLRPQKIGRLMGPITGTSSHIEWRPYGVVGCITPWNYPFMNCFVATAPPLFAGNAVVIKPSEAVPGCGELIREVLEPLPAGVATVIQGRGDVGGALVDAPCDKISFVGSPVTGRRICEAAAKHLTPVVMELGGKDAAIVCDDADLDIATSGVLWGSFFNAGQTCCSIERVYVVDSVADEFKQRLTDKLSEVRFAGDEAEIGSLTVASQLEIVERHVAQAVEKGASIVAGGPDAGPGNTNGSLWYAPTVVEGVNDEMDVLTKETFGPVLTMVRVRDDEEAVRRANEEGANLTASVWTRDRKRADALGSRLRAGTVGMNDHGAFPGSTWAPWGGVGESGYGRLNGELGIKEFVYPVHVAYPTMSRVKKLWWYPYNEASDETFRSLAAILGARGVGRKAAAVRSLLGAIGKTIKTRL